MDLIDLYLELHETKNHQILGEESIAKIKEYLIQSLSSSPQKGDILVDDIRELLKKKIIIKIYDIHDEIRRTRRLRKVKTLVNKMIKMAVDYYLLQNVIGCLMNLRTRSFSRNMNIGGYLDEVIQDLKYKLEVLEKN